MSVPLEIERKYLLSALPSFPPPSVVYEIEQGYLPGENLVERLRREKSHEGIVRYYRTVKLGSGVQRVELEDETDADTFQHLWILTSSRRLRKRRYVVANRDDLWEIDEFLDRPLVLAELEIPSIDAGIDVPGWMSPVLVREVTDEKAYTNRSLAR